MTAFNIVRFRVKPGQEKTFIDVHRNMKRPFKGFGGGWLVKTGDQTFCLVGQWRSFQDIVNARPEMIGLLDQTRALLEDLGGGLGVTDPVSGEAVARLGGARPARKRAATAGKAKAAKKSAKPARKRSSPSGKRKPAAKKRAR